MTVKELISIVLDSPFYLSMPLQERRDYIRSFVARYLTGRVDRNNEKSQNRRRANLSVADSVLKGTR